MRDRRALSAEQIKSSKDLVQEERGTCPIPHDRLELVLRPTTRCRGRSLPARARTKVET
jgi:hypothetical protein